MGDQSVECIQKLSFFFLLMFRNDGNLEKNNFLVLFSVSLFHYSDTSNTKYCGKFLLVPKCL